MLLKVNKLDKIADRIHGEKLCTFNFKEADLQKVLFHSLSELLYDRELLVIMQSRKWQEEPDLMALDKNGRLFIFELKAWESKSDNLLQVLRYGQKYGKFRYDELNRYCNQTDMPLSEAHRNNFDITINENNFNSNQTFVVMTNGLDYSTREGISYWRKKDLDIRPWVYRAYKNDQENEFLLEISPFSIEDNPYEDITGQGYYILNTDSRNAEHPEHHDDMIKCGKAAAYDDPWKYKITRLRKGDVVFLYKSGSGIVAFGTANGKLEKRPEPPDEEYFMHLNKFKMLEKPLPAVRIKEITSVDYRYMSTMFGIDEDSGKKLCHYINQISNNELG